MHQQKIKNKIRKYFELQKKKKRKTYENIGMLLKQYSQGQLKHLTPSILGNKKNPNQ